MSKNKTWMIVLFLTAAILLAFWQVNYCDFIPQYDDNDYVTKNSHIQNGISIEGIRWAFTATHAANWHPLTWMSHMLDVQLFGLNPRGHHLTNLFFHIANTLLLFLVLNRMTKALWQSAFVAALFAIHPLHVESVAWVAERKDVLSTFFWMLTLEAYLYYVESPEPKRYLLVLVLFAIGLMAKPMLVTLPFVLLLLDYWPLKRFGQRIVAPEGEQPAGPKYHWASIRPLIWEKTPLFVLAALSSIVTYVVQQQAGAVVSIEAIPLIGRVSNAFVSYTFYIDKMIWPIDLAVLYPHPGLWPLWLVVGAGLPIIAATITVILKAQSFPYLAVGWLWYVGTLVPVIGLVQVGIQTRADRYSYIPLIGLFIIAAWGFPEIIKKWRYRKEALASLSALSLLCLLALTWTQAGYWKNSLSLFDHTLKVTDRNSIMYNNRGLIYGNLGNYTRAIEDFDKAIEIDPKYAKAHINRGLAYDNLGNYTRAIEEFDRAIEIDPKFSMTYYHRGIACGKLGNHALAIENLDKAIEINPKYAIFYYSRGMAYGKLGNHSRAIVDFDRAIEIDPKFLLAYYNRGMAYGNLGRYEQAYEDLKTAAILGSEDAKNFLKSHDVSWQ
jgi:protein O-mannosyl-transferase